MDSFEGTDDLREHTTSERIVQFLSVHDDQAYTRREIADVIDATPETVGTNLTRLKDRGLVRHREPYWALTDDRERASTALRAQHEDDENKAGAEETATFSSAQSSDGPHREAAAAFFTRVRDRLDDAIDALYLFGSVARDSETETSDVDVLAVIADDADYAAVDNRLLDIAYHVQLENAVPVEVHSIEASEFDSRRERNEPFVRNIVEEGERSV